MDLKFYLEELHELKFYLEDLFGLEVDLITEKVLKPQLKDIIMKDVVYA